ncbi:hypothetical protein quinque_004772 [Culex quinquefasciatus]
MLILGRFCSSGNDLRYNHIREVPTDAFAGLSHLHTVFLNENQLRRIEPGAFRGLPGLKYLYLNKNRIVEVAPSAFDSLDRLQSLFLYGNQIRRIPEGAFAGLPALKHLRLDDNPLECDCSLLWFRRVLHEARQTLLATSSCATPEQLVGKSLADLGEDDFHCTKPEIVSEPRDIEISNGQTAVFTCKAHGDPRPEIVWMLDAGEIHSDDTRINVLPDGSLRIDEVTAADAGMYECRARNNMGQVQSRPARMVVSNEVIETEAEAPKFIQTPPAEVELKVGAALVLHCVVSGEFLSQGAPTPSILWKFNNQNIQNGRIKLFGNGSLILPVATLDDGGVYSCYAGNAIGNVSVNATVQVNGEFLSVYCFGRCSRTSVNICCPSFFSFATIIIANASVDACRNIGAG